MFRQVRDLPHKTIHSAPGSALSLPCTLLLALALSACDGGGSGPEQPTGDFDLLSYNVAGLPEGVSGSSPSVNHPLISAKLNGYELALVQEDFWYHDLLAISALHPYQSPPSVSSPTLTNLGDGLNRFSELRFDVLYRVPWNQCNGVIDCGSDCLTDKGFSMAPTLVNNVRVDVYNLHMDAGGCAGDLQARESQRQQLADYMAANSAGNPVIVVGDFNQNDLPAAFLSGTGLADACQAVGCGDNRIDKVLFRGSATLGLTPLQWRIPTEFVDGNQHPLSDHEPVAVRFRWEGGG